MCCRYQVSNDNIMIFEICEETSEVSNNLHHSFKKMHALGVHIRVKQLSREGNV